MPYMNLRLIIHYEFLRILLQLSEFDSSAGISLLKKKLKPFDTFSNIIKNVGKISQWKIGPILTSAHVILPAAAITVYGYLTMPTILVAP